MEKNLCGRPDGILIFFSTFTAINNGPSNCEYIFGKNENFEYFSSKKFSTVLTSHVLFRYRARLLLFSLCLITSGTLKMFWDNFRVQFICSQNIFYFRPLFSPETISAQKSCFLRTVPQNGLLRGISKILWKADKHKQFFKPNFDKNNIQI